MRILARWFLAIVVLAAAAQASAGPASAPANQGELQSMTFTIQFKDLEDVLILLKPLIGERGSFTVLPRLKAITVMDEPKNLVRISKVIADFDQPPRSVRLVIQILAATEARPASTSTGTSTGVRSLLQDVTKYSEVSVIGSASIIGVEGADSSLSVGDRFRVRFHVDSVAATQGVVRFGRFAMDKVVREPNGDVKYLNLWDTVINLRDKHQLLLGATSSQESKHAVFLSVTATIEPEGGASAAH